MRKIRKISKLHILAFGLGGAALVAVGYFLHAPTGPLEPARPLLANIPVGPTAAKPDFAALLKASAQGSAKTSSLGPLQGAHKPRTQDERQKFMKAELQLTDSEIDKFHALLRDYSRKIRGAAQNRKFQGGQDLGSLFGERQRSLEGLLGQGKLDKLQWWESGASEKMPLERWLESQKSLKRNRSLAEQAGKHP